MATQGDLINNPVQARAMCRPVGKLKEVQDHCNSKDQR